MKEIIFKKVEGEHFDSMILSFATKLLKERTIVDKYRMSVENPTQEEPFYQVLIEAYQGNKVVKTSHGGLRNNPEGAMDLIDLEKQVAEEYSLNLKVHSFV